MKRITQKIIPHLWFDEQAEEAAAFYTSLFENSSIGRVTSYSNEGYEIHGRPAGSTMTVDFELAGYKMIALNGGPHFRFTPAISFFVVCEKESEVDALWDKLSEGGSPLMPLDRYDWSEKYGWVKDRYGLAWHLYLGNLDEVHGQKIMPMLMYVSEQGQAEEAMKLYTSLFKNSKIDGILHYGKGEDQPEGSVMHAQFLLDGELFMAMDSAPKHADFGFNEAVSLLVQCETQQEIDHYWNKLSVDSGAEQCGWLKDKFGVSWQIVPAGLDEMINDADPEKVRRVTKAVLSMKKLDIEKLEEAYR